MEEKQKALLERNRGLLVGNIVMSPDFYHLLRSEHVLPDTMVHDIQSRKCQHERNSRLLEMVKMCGGDVYRKLRHVLYLSGHQFLADHLHGEDNETKVLKAEDVFSKFPKVFNHVSDDMKTRLLKYLETKVREKATANAWLTSSRERGEVMDSRKILFDAEKDYKIRLEDKTKKVTKLTEELRKLTAELNARDEEGERVQGEMEDMQKTFKHDLAKQSRFNAANNNSIIQLKDRFDHFNDRVKWLNIAVRRFLEPGQDKDIDEDPDNIKITLLELNVRTLIQLSRSSMESTSNIVSEKQAVLDILQASPHSSDHALSEIVKHYVDKQEKGKVALSKELDLLMEVVHGHRHRAKVAPKPPNTDLKLLRTQIAMLREEVEHIKKKLEWKDNQISELIKENSDLQEQSMSHGISQKSVTLPVLTGSHQMNQDTVEYDVYMNETVTPPPTRRPSYVPRNGSLADVDLERPFSPPHRSRRNSRFDLIDLDILGNSSTGALAPPYPSNVPAYRRSVTDMRSTKTFGNLKSSSSSSIEKKSPMSSYGVTLDVPVYVTNRNDAHVRTDANVTQCHGDGASGFVNEGKAHSLAELITIYESSKDSDPRHNIRLPALQET